MNKLGHGGQAAGDSPYCPFHPRELVVGVCAHCLKDRLRLLLAANKQDGGDEHASFRPSLRRRTSSISLPKVFALGSSFLQRIDSRHHQRHCYSDDDDTSAASLDDSSFISIKFEDNGKATWDKKQLAAATHKAPAPATRVVVVAEQAKRGGVTRWRKQVVGRLLQLARWKRSAADASKDSKPRGRGWIRSLTRRRPHGDRPWP